MKVALAYSSKNGLLEEYKNAKGVSAESEIPADFFAEGDSPETINAVMNALREGGHEVYGVEADNNALENLNKIKPDLVFNIAEGLFGDFRESYIPALCERLGLRYTGSGPMELAICLNKSRCKEVLSYYKVPTPIFKRFTEKDEIDLDGMRYPVIVKPEAEGSSKGVFNDSVVDSFEDAAKLIKSKIEKYNQPVIVEEFITGDEFTVALWGNGNDIEVLPPVAISYKDLPPGAKPLYSYEAKWIWDVPDKPLEIFRCPADISEKLKLEIEAVVKKAFNVLGLRDWSRIDVRLDAAGKPNILEVNPLPGILPKAEDNSCFPKAARTAGYTYSQMLNKILKIAERRFGCSYGHR